MLVTGFAIAAGAAAKWLLAAKIITAVGTACVTADRGILMIQQRKALKKKKEAK